MTSSSPRENKPVSAPFFHGQGSVDRNKRVICPPPEKYLQIRRILLKMAYFGQRYFPFTGVLEGRFFDDMIVIVPDFLPMEGLYEGRFFLASAVAL